MASVSMDSFPYRHEALGVVFQVREGRLNVLLWQRAELPFLGSWALPGGPLLASERLGTSASRHLAAKVDISEIAHLEQLETRSDPARDPRERVLATAYLALVTTGAQARLPADTRWYTVDELPSMAFDHGSIIGSARERLRAKLSYTNIGFALAPETFTIAALRDIYAAALGHPISATNLQRILTRRGVIEPTSGMAPPTAAGGRPAALFRFVCRELVVTNPFAAFRPRVASLLDRLLTRTSVRTVAIAAVRTDASLRPLSPLGQRCRPGSRCRSDRRSQSARCTGTPGCNCRRCHW